MKLDAYEAEVKEEWELARQLWIRVNVAARGSDMQAIEAFSRIAQRLGESSVPPKNPEVIILPRGDRSVVSEPAPTGHQAGLQVFQFEVVKINASGQEVKRESSKAQYFIEDLGNGVSLEMIAIPSGKFLMGSPSGEGNDQEKPQHEVTVQSFFMGKYSVTQAQWKRVAALPKVNHCLKADPSYFKGDKRPVEQVSWNDAVEFCDRLSKYTNKQYCLPSEAEWEYACRAATTTPFHFGETITTELANYNGNSTYASAPKGKNRGETIEIGSFPANAFGLYDMHGNVWEWCQDTWHGSYKGAPQDGSAWIDNDNQSYILRGGSWFYNPKSCRSASRFNFLRAERVSIFNYVGFRVVCGVGRTL
ncbi:MAG: formylglycine-generating enzyme family protein [Nostoc sp.]|uniref:formylglycine-generating enzyme family protein n=1 Tax=Nostoc sp. TaxID=1180 RepID=UPI002FF0FB35